MADFISSFIEATNSNGGMSFSNSFKVDIRGTGMSSGGNSISDDYGMSGDNMFSFLCDEAQLPNVQAATGTLKGRYLGEGQINYAHTRVFTEFQLGFQCDASMTPLLYLNDWFGQIFGEIPKAGKKTYLPQRSTTVEYPTNYCRDIYITKTEAGEGGATSRQSVCYVMERAWPFAVDAVPLQFGTAQLTKVTAQFYYTRHHIVNKGGYNEIQQDTAYA